jgi:hypothetical protein
VTTTSGSWQHDLVELLETLGRHEVPFLVVGGYAVAHAGHLRATKDLDVFVPRLAGIDARLARALSEFASSSVARHQDLADVEELVRIRRDQRREEGPGRRRGW